MVELICHEAYHAFQWRQLEVFFNVDEELQSLQMFEVVALYAVEVEAGYITGEEHYDEYYEQTIEKMSRLYAAMEAVDYYVQLGLEINMGGW